MTLLKLTQIDGNKFLVVVDAISEILPPLNSMDSSKCQAVLMMINGNRHQVLETIAYIESKLT